MQVLYTFEHKILPGIFYENPEMLVTRLLEDKDKCWRLTTLYLTTLYLDVLTNVGSKPLGKFEARKIELADGFYGVEVDCPVVDGMEFFVLNTRFYMLLDSEKRGAFVTIEADPTGNFVCGWSSPSVHMNFGKEKDYASKEDMLVSCAKAMISARK